MNIQLHYMITKLIRIKIIKAIVDGKRDAQMIRKILTNYWIITKKHNSTNTRKVIDKASTAFRLAGLSTSKCQSTIAEFFKKLKNRCVAKKQSLLWQKKLLCMFYRLLKYGQNYVEREIETYDNKYKYNETMKKLKNTQQN